ncbi:hypothetical protein [Kribbella sp. CA-294648]|uniref:hypothetical protein n=1 Tax=Kribbella sp. CA-294648 TaxID=3239948 RepID=UPI003D8F6376
MLAARLRGEALDAQAQEGLQPVGLVIPMATATDHRDVTPTEQPYVDGMFVSLCSCGREFTGNDPHEADFALYEHTETAN